MSLVVVGDSCGNEAVEGGEGGRATGQRRWIWFGYRDGDRPFEELMVAVVDGGRSGDWEKKDEKERKRLKGKNYDQKNRSGSDAMMKKEEKIFLFFYISKMHTRAYKYRYVDPNIDIE